MANNERVVGFAVKARDEYSKVLKNLEQQQNKLSAAAQAANRRQTIGVAKSEIDTAVANYKRLTSEVERYRTVQANAAKTGKLSESEMRELGDTIKLVRDRSREAMDAIQQKRAALASLNKTAVSGYAAFDRLATSLQRGATAAVEENAAVASTATGLRKLDTASSSAATAQGVLKKRIDATTASMTRQRAGGGVKGNAQDIEVFGLRPWQLTNLGYQVNDVVSGLAMGQAPLQILAQQAGQFAQIWPGVMVALARSIPIIAGVTAVLSPFIATALRLHNFSESVREFSHELALSADGARYNAEAMAKAVEQIEDFGIAADKARDLVKQFFHEGFDQKDFAPLAKLAKELSDVTGESIADAGKRLSKAFSGTVEDVRDLDKELNFLTADQLDSLRATEKAGKSADALSLAQEILAGKLAAARDETTDWTEAVDHMSNAWDHLVNVVDDSGVVQKGYGFLNSLAWYAEKAALAIDTAVGVIDGRISNLEQDAGRIKSITDQITRLRQFNDYESERGRGGSLQVATNKQTISDLEDELRVLQDRVTARQEELQAIKDGTTAQADAGRLSEADKKIRSDIQVIIDKQLKTLGEETDQAKLTNRERFIENELLKAKNAALAEAKKQNQSILDLTAEQTKQIRARADAAYSAAHPNYEAQFTAQRDTPEGKQMAALVAAISVLAEKMQLNVKDLLTAISFETGGTFDPSIKGGKGGKYVGLFQASPDVQKRYGINEFSTVEDQIVAMGKYLADAGVKAGDGLLQIYAAINAGSAKKINASDEANGGTHGTVLDKVSEQMGDHQKKAEGILAAYGGIAEQAKKTAEFQIGLDERLEKSRLELDLAKKKTREAYIAKELQDEEVKARKAGTELTAQEIENIKKVSAATYDQQHVNDEVNRLIEQRTALFESLQIAQTAGDQDKVASVVGQIVDVESQLDSAIEKAIAFWQALGGPGSEQAIANLRNIQDAIGQTLRDINEKFLPTAEGINEQLADIGANAFGAFAQAIANGENAAEALFAALRQGIAEFLIEIGKAILKQALFNALSGIGGSGGVGGSINSFIASFFHHDGEIVGSGGRPALVNPAIFANAQRFHGGGIVGLGPNEKPIIALKDEEVLTSDDPRHIRNGGGRGQAINLKNVNVFDPIDVLEAALASVAGEKVMLNYLTRNRTKVGAAISG